MPCPLSCSTDSRMAFRLCGIDADVGSSRISSLGECKSPMPILRRPLHSARVLLSLVVGALISPMISSTSLTRARFALPRSP